MKLQTIMLIALLSFIVGIAQADIILDNFDNDRAVTNGAGNDAYWNPPPTPPFQVDIETQKVYSGTAAALKVSWENKDMWPNFVIGKLQMEGNAGPQFFEADAVRMAIAGPAGNIIMKFADSNGKSTGDLCNIPTSGSDEYQLYEFPYFDAISSSSIDLDKLSEIWLLVDAGQQGTSGTIYIDSIELIAGSGENAEVIGTIDNFDNDNSLEDQPGVADSAPSGNTFLPGAFTTSVVDDPAGSGGAVLKVDYNTSPWQVLWVEDLDVTDWSEATELTIDVYGTAGGILLKLKDINGTEEEPTGGLQRHDGDEWGTLSWGMGSLTTVDATQINKLIVFVEGSTGGQGTIYFDNLTLVGATRIEQWCLY